TLPASSPLNAISFPSGEKCGFVVWPWKLVRRRAAPPARSTTQMLLAYAKAICVALTVGERSRRVESPLADADAATRVATHAGNTSHGSDRRTRRTAQDVIPSLR